MHHGGHPVKYVVGVVTRTRWTAQNSEGHEAPVALAADAVVLTVRDGAFVALVIAREDGRALPGALVRAGEAPEDTVRRTLRDKAGLEDVYVEQLATFADPGRDERGWIPTVAHVALVPPDTTPRDANASWLPARGRHRLAFDHRAILDLATDRVRGKLWWSNVAVGVLPGPFSMREARDVYAAIAEVDYDPATFARDLKATGLVEPTGERRSEGPGRPATLFRFRDRTPAWGAGRRKRV